MIGRFFTWILLLSILVVSCSKDDVVVDNTAPGTNEGGGSSPVVYNVNKATLLQLVNNVRKAGCNCGNTKMPPVAPVAWNDRLAKAGYDHSVEMNANNYFSHTGENGSSPGQRISAAGYAWKTYGENIAKGYTTEQAVVNGWINSEGHCKNIMNGKFKEMGAGRAGNYWTQVFGAK